MKEAFASRRPVARLAARTGTRLLALLGFSAAMGWLEAVVVVYIRGLTGITRLETIPPPAETMRRFAQVPWLLPTEQSREAATLVMLAAVSVLAAYRWRGRFGAFLISFGVWDLVYYLALYLQIHWPPSLATKDLLFLIPPHPWWYQPVWVPMAISCVMILIGLRLFLRQDRRRRWRSRMV